MKKIRDLESFSNGDFDQYMQERKRDFYREIEQLREENNSLVFGSSYKQSVFNQSEGSNQNLKMEMRILKEQLMESQEREQKMNGQMRDLITKNKNLTNENFKFKKKISDLQNEIFELKKEVSRPQKDYNHQKDFQKLNLELLSQVDDYQDFQ